MDFRTPAGGFQGHEEPRLLAAEESQPLTSSVSSSSAAESLHPGLAGAASSSSIHKKKVVRLGLAVSLMLLGGMAAWLADLHGLAGADGNAPDDASTAASPREALVVDRWRSQSQWRPLRRPKVRRRRASFLVIGDWGFDSLMHGNLKGGACQRVIADRMLEKMEELGDVKFVINVGDSFYPGGVTNKSDPQWETKWRQVYSEKLRSVPWYSVYGNHDYDHDPCMCSEDPLQCAQVNTNSDDRNYFFMPNVSYFVSHPELDLEVVGLDLNTYVNGWNPAISRHEFWACHYSSCPWRCREIAWKRSQQAFELFHNRRTQSTAKNLLVFSHYPTDYFRSVPHFLDGLRDPAKRTVYFGGHRHNVDQYTTESTHPNANWVVGGGGGWSCDGGEQGFVVGEISEDFEVSTYSVLVPPSTCCS
eukprot:TRINITY_DN19528_c0_g2_i1.p1 TRINITY_DN19528_c0_g2~~TRINITY_DN19528_c0_g2_i1.p1  ORF type:complete len:418 (-),score=55.34 TRINITY_DN19528_c0_g2_i1:427-1680(-)